MVDRRESPNEGRAAETNLAPSRYVVMRIREKKSVGPMSIQPGRYVTICPALPLMPTAGEPSETPPSRKRDTRSDAVRVAKAKISRRRSLKKQREAQKAQARENTERWSARSMIEMAADWVIRPHTVDEFRFAAEHAGRQRPKLEDTTRNGCRKRRFGTRRRDEIKRTSDEHHGSKR
jgi:hypothetical protein